MAIRRAVVYRSRAAHTFSAGIKCHNCKARQRCDHLRDNLSNRKVVEKIFEEDLFGLTQTVDIEITYRIEK